MEEANKQRYQPSFNVADNKEKYGVEREQKKGRLKKTSCIKKKKSNCISLNASLWKVVSLRGKCWLEHATQTPDEDHFPSAYVPPLMLKHYEESTFSTQLKHCSKKWWIELVHAETLVNLS